MRKTEQDGNHEITEISQNQGCREADGIFRSIVINEGIVKDLAFLCGKIKIEIILF